MEPEKLILALSQARLEADLEALARIGAARGGITRLGYTAAEREAHSWAADKMCLGGMGVRVDGAGNTIGLKPGVSPDLSPILIGSHLDTVPNGGKFDGTVGVVAGLEVVRTLSESGFETRHPLELVVFTCEEAARFGEGTLGSQAVTGQLGPAHFEMADDESITLAEAMADLGLPLEDISQARRNSGEITAYVELHVEQSSTLEELDRTIGLVEAIAGPTRLLVTLEGESNHSGSTPMAGRRDALAAAAEIVLVVEEIARHRAGPTTVATVGVLEVHPGSMTVIPGLVRMGIEVRDVEKLAKQTAIAQIRQAVQNIATTREIEFAIEILGDREPRALSIELIRLATEVCENLRISYHRMNSMAAHDAQQIARIAPAALLFIPSVGGVSHSPQEFTESRHILTGTRALAGLVLAIDAAF